jgi:3',5'-cyclic AMP phosphodiesterase CpdA
MRQLSTRDLPGRNRNAAGIRFRWVALTLLILVGSLYGCQIFSSPTEMPTLAEQEQTTQASEAPAAAPPEATLHVLAPTETQNPTLAPTPLLTHTPSVDYFRHDLPLGQAGYVIPLSVRHVSENQAVLFFELSEPAPGKIVYQRIEPREQVELPLQADQTRFQIVLEGLEPSVAYQAAVLLGEGSDSFSQPGFGGEAWGPINFETPSGEYPIRVGVVGDASFGDEMTSRLIERMVGYDLDFVLHTGDIVYVDPGEVDPFSAYLERFYEPFAPLLHQMPVYTVMGNHDYDRSIRYNDEPFYFHAFPPFQDAADPTSASRARNQFYSFGRGQVQFLMLDSQVLFGVEGRQEQENWIGDRLADSRYVLSIPVFHVSPFSSSVVHPEDSLPVRATWAQLFEQVGVPLVFSGHFHHYERSISNGTTFIVSGGGSSTLYAMGKPLPESQFYARRTHFVLLEIYPGRLELAAIDPEGQIIDQVMIQLNDS